MTISYSEKSKPVIYNITAKTFSGLEMVLAEEIKKIGGTDIKPGEKSGFRFRKGRTIL